MSLLKNGCYSLLFSAYGYFRKFEQINPVPFRSSKMRVPEHIRHLDVGSGDGAYAKTFSNSKSVHLELNRRNAKNGHKLYGLAYVVCDVQNLPFKKNLFSYVTGHEIIEHVPKPEMLIQEIFRVTQEEAKIVITTQNRNMFNLEAFKLIKSKLLINTMTFLLKFKLFKVIFKGSLMNKKENAYSRWKKNVGHVTDGFTEEDFNKLTTGYPVTLKFSYSINTFSQKIMWELQQFIMPMLKYVFFWFTPCISFFEGKNHDTEGYNISVKMEKMVNSKFCGVLKQ